MNFIPAQPDDWQQLGVYEVAEGVYRIPLPLPMADLSTVNCYLFVSDSEAVLVDPGFASDNTKDLLGQALSSLGLDWSNISKIVATHTHWDHYSQAITLRDEHKIPVLLGREERHTVNAESLKEGTYPRQIEKLYTSGAGSLAQIIESLPLEPHETDVPFGHPDVYVTQGDTIEFGNRTLKVHETPGHTRGHIVLNDHTTGVQVTGDHILPRITPSIGLELRPEQFPLTSYINSLNKSLTSPDTALLGAHGPVTPSVHARAKELLEHHTQRFEDIMATIEAGASTAYEVAQQLRWTRRNKQLTQMNPVHQMLAVLEVYAHLETLTSFEELKSEQVDDIVYFEHLQLTK